MATPDEMRQATIVAQTSYEGAAAHAGQSRTHCQETTVEMGLLLPLIEQALVLTTQFDTRLKADKANADSMARRQEAARSQIFNSGMQGTTNPDALTLINNTRTLGEVISALGNTLVRAEEIAEQSGRAALPSYLDHLGIRKRQLGNNATAYLDDAKADYQQASTEAEAYRGHIALAETVAQSAAHVREAGRKTATVNKSAEKIKGQATIVKDKLSKLNELALKLKELRWLAESQRKQAGAKIDDGNDTLSKVGVVPGGQGKDIFVGTAQAKNEIARIPFVMHGFDTIRKELGELATALGDSFEQIASEQKGIAIIAQNTAILCDRTADAGEAYARQYINVEGTGQ